MNTNFASYINFEDLRNNSEEFKMHVQQRYIIAALFFVGIYFVVAAFSIPGAFALTTAGGFLFGTTLSTAYVLLGATSGAILAFLASRYLAGNYIQKKYGSHLVKVNKEIAKNGENYILMLRFISIPPFFILNLLAGLTKIDLKTFIWTTAVGILPGTLIYSYAGSNLSRIEEPRDILSPHMIYAFLLLGLLSVLPVLIKKFFKRKYS